MLQINDRFGSLIGLDHCPESEIASILSQHGITRFDEYVGINSSSCIQLDGAFSVNDLRCIVALAEKFASEEATSG